MPSLPKAMRLRFRTAFEASKYKSLRQLSQDAGCNPSQAGKIVRGSFDTAKDGPGLFGVWRMAEQMEVDLKDLVPPSFDHSDRPGVAAFFKRYRGQDTSIHEFSDILEFCDIYAEPNRGRCKLISQGPRSLLSEKTGKVDVERQQEEYETWPAEKRAAIFNWQRRAWQSGALAEPVYFKGSYGFLGIDLEGYILRAACRVLGDDLQPRLLLYADMLWQEHRSTSDKQRKALST